MFKEIKALFNILMQLTYRKIVGTLYLWFTLQKLQNYE